MVVVFYSRFGSTEQLALAAAVGAVQGRANIRLRRLPDTADEAMMWMENRERMNREYVAPREADVEWADAIVVGMPAGTDTVSVAFERYFDRGKIDGKVGASFTPGLLTGPLDAVMRRAGLIMVPMIPAPDLLTAARLQGRRVADMVRSLRVSK